MEKKIDRIGMWTWGGRVYNWKRYIDNMQVCKMNSMVLWHNEVPANAHQIQNYAADRGIEIIWGFNWSWNSPICLNSKEDSDLWRDRVLKIMDQQYASLNPSAICFQTGGTEFGGSCRLDCSVCREAAEAGVGTLFVKFSKPIIEAVQKQYPQLKIYANVHLGSMKVSYKALSALPKSVPIMYEDLPGPRKHIEIPFTYNWGSDPAFGCGFEDNAPKPSTLEMVRHMCQLRGPDEEVAFIIKGFPCIWGGHDPMLLEEFDLKALAKVYEHVWDYAAIQCEQHLEEALQVFRIIADSPAHSKMVLLLVEHGLWELKRYYPAVLINEALQNPHREADEIVSAAKQSCNRLVHNHRNGCAQAETAPQ